MDQSLLASLAPDHSAMLSEHHRIQIALAIADPDLLKSLLVNCTPPLVQPHRVGSVHSSMGIPLTAGLMLDAILEFEEVHCVLADSSERLAQEVAIYCQRYGNQRGYLDLTRCEAETRTLGQTMPLAQAIATLSEAGFTPAQVNRILNLSLDAWFQSWWYRADEIGELTIPFLRLLRVRHFADGTVTLQYKDFFAQDQPACFTSVARRILVDTLSDQHEFPAVLAKINLARQQTGIQQALLIGNQISALEAQGFIRQGISLYATREVALPVQANCVTCATSNCPMRGQVDSPVLLCRQFCLPAESG
jgi:hypothetical protein